MIYINISIKRNILLIFIRYYYNCFKAFIEYYKYYKKKLFIIILIYNSYFLIIIIKNLFDIINI